MLLKKMEEKSILELKKSAEGLREEIAKLRFDLSLNKLKDTNMIKKKRKDLARILTAIRQKEITEEQNA